MANGGQQASNSRSARVNPYLPGHHEGWMMGGQETVFHWVSILENQPIINKTKHPTKGEKKVRDGRTQVLADKESSKESGPLGE